MRKLHDDTDHLLQLLLGQLTDDIGEEEQAQLQAWLDKSPANRALYDELQDEETLGRLYREQHAFDTVAARSRIVEQLANAKKRTFRRWLPYAAAVLILTTVTLFFINHHGSRPLAVAGNGQVGDVLPGGFKATLTLGSGQVITLDETKTGIVVQDGHITYQDKGSQIVASDALDQSREPEMFTLTTPRGGTYQLTLPDGSQVWLNAASTLRYPSRFTGNTRVVELSGEAYFSVVKSAIDKGAGKTENARFSVISNGQTVEVLGTEFNVSAYPDEQSTKTTLVEGKVQINLPAVATGEAKSVAIVPGQQAILHHAQVAVESANINAAISWKSGKFTFDGKPFEEIMNEMARWYNLEVVYAGAVPSGKLVGDAYRNQNLSIVLGMLDVLEVDYELDADQRKLTIR